MAGGDVEAQRILPPDADAAPAGGDGGVRRAAGAAALALCLLAAVGWGHGHAPAEAAGGVPAAAAHAGADAGADARDAGGVARAASVSVRVGNGGIWSDLPAWGFVLYSIVPVFNYVLGGMQGESKELGTLLPVCFIFMMAMDLGGTLGKIAVAGVLVGVVAVVLEQFCAKSEHSAHGGKLRCIAVAIIILASAVELASRL